MYNDNNDNNNNNNNNYFIYLLFIRDESRVLPIAIPVIISLPPDTHYAIRCTSLKLIGELSHWIGAHPDTLSKRKR